MMEPDARDFYRDMAFYAEDTAFAGMNLRPLSLCSDRAMQMMGLRLFDAEVDLSMEEESRQMALFVWLHSAPLPEVCEHLWDTNWTKFGEITEPMPGLVDEFRKWRARIILLLEACAFTVRAKPKPPGVINDTPKDMVHPTQLADMIGSVVSYTGFPRQHVKWHLFLPEAVLLYHTALRSMGVWTVPKGRTVTEDQVADRAPDWLPPPPAVDTPSAP